MSYPELTPAQRELADYMSDLSEEHYCAGWLNDLEFALWGFVVDGPGMFGVLRVTPGKIARLIQLSSACGGWIVWRDEDQSETSLPMTEWLALYAEHEGEVPQ